MINRLIYRIGEYLRNPSLESWYKFLMKSDKWTLDCLEEYQEKKLVDLFDFAIENSPFYKKKYKGIKLNKLEDLTNLPLLDKEDLLQYNDEIHTGFQGKVFNAKTSGSSGSILKFERNESADSFSRAAMKRGYSWHDVQPFDRNIYFWGFNFKGMTLWKIRLLDFLQSRIRIFDYTPKSMNLVRRYSNHLKYISGYSSMINELALSPTFDKMCFPNLRMIKGTSEEILPYYKENVKKTFGIPLISEYGATESGIIGFECPHGNIHINMEGVIVEEMDNEIIITNLHLMSFPIIRYRLGDYIELDNQTKCKCGRAHKIIKSIKGRVGSKLKGNYNSYPSLTIYRIFGNLSELGFDYNYQIFQNEPGVVEIRLSDTLKEGEQAIRKEFYKYFKDDISYSIVENYNFEGRLSKKKFFINQLDEK